MRSVSNILCSVVFSILAICYSSQLLANPSISNRQCQPGPESGNNGILSDCIANSNPNGWKSGLNQGPFTKGQSVPFRALMEDLVQGDTYTLIIEWDITAGSQFAYDYLTTFNRTLTNADPCSDHGTVAICLDTDTFAIPTDPEITAGFDGITGNADDITQTPGDMTLYGGTIQSVNYSYSDVTGSGTMGDPYVYPTASSRRITVVFTSDEPNNNNAGPVLAWGGHIGRDADWGVGNADPGGSPYHMRFNSWTCTAGDCSTGQQDLALANADPEPTYASIGYVKVEAIDVNTYISSIGASDSVIGDLDPDGDGKVALFQWETLSEHGTIGFNVERQDTNGNWVRINDQILPSFLSPLGGEYMLVDPDVTAGKSYNYRLIELEAKGHVRNYGPFTLEF